MADRIAVMRAGRILQEGSPAQIYTQPSSAFIADFLSDVNWLHGSVEGGAVTSPLGPLAVGGIGDGERVDVLIRPEAIHIAPGGGEGAVAAEVVGVHLLGHSSIVELRPDGNAYTLRARLPGVRAPRCGERVALRLDDSQAFVFPCGVPTKIE